MARLERRLEILGDYWRLLETIGERFLWKGSGKIFGKKFRRISKRESREEQRDECGQSGS